MGDLEESYDEISLQRRDINGSYIYRDHNNNLFNDNGKRIFSTKFETLFEGDNKQQIKIKEVKEIKEEVKEKEVKVVQVEEGMSSQVMECAHQYTDGIVNILLETFEGKVVGSDDFNHETIMKELFGDYKPGDKKVSVKEKKPKKKRPLTGYTYYGRENKETINQLAKEAGDDKGYLEIQSELWKKLSKDEKAEWSKKAKDAFTEEHGEENVGE